LFYFFPFIKDAPKRSTENIGKLRGSQELLDGSSQGSQPEPEPEPESEVSEQEVQAEPEQMENQEEIEA